MFKSSRFIFLIVALFILNGCQQFIPIAEQTVTPTSAPTTTATVTLTPSPTLMPTQIPCTETEGKIMDIQVPTDRLSRPIETKVYLPPCYDAKRQQAYPLLYLLHGQSDLNDQWIRIGLTGSADEMITNHEIAPMIIVFPYEISWRIGPDESQYGEALIKDLLPYIQSKYNACGDRSCRAIGGLSRGGNWAVYLGFKYPEVFTAIGAHSTPLFFGEIGRVDIEAEKVPPTGFPAIYVDVGIKDPQKQQVLDFVQALNNNHIQYEFFQFIGYHDERYWGAHVRDYLTWYESQIGQNPGN